MNLVTKDGLEMKNQLISKVNTTEWHGQVSHVNNYVQDGDEFKVMKLPLGTQATINFTSEYLVMTDRTQLNVKGGIAVRDMSVCTSCLMTCSDELSREDSLLLKDVSHET